MEVEEIPDSPPLDLSYKEEKLSTKEIKSKHSEPTFITLINHKQSKGALNKDVVFLKIAQLKRGDMFVSLLELYRTILKCNYIRLFLLEQIVCKLNSWADPEILKGGGHIYRFCE